MSVAACAATRLLAASISPQQPQRAPDGLIAKKKTAPPPARLTTSSSCSNSAKTEAALLWVLQRSLSPAYSTTAAASVHVRGGRSLSAWRAAARGLDSPPHATPSAPARRQGTCAAHPGCTA
eukprot:7130344-Prymnesium_polylepis.2